IHLEEFSVTLADLLFAEALNGVAEIEIHAASGLTHATTLVTHLLRGARRDVTPHNMPEARVLSLEVVVALGLGNLARWTLVAALFRHPHASVVAKGFAHQRELRLVIAAHRNAGRMNLCEARVRERGTALVCAPDRRGVAILRVRGQVEHVSVSTRGEHHPLRRTRLDRSRPEIARDDPARLPVHENDIEHLGVREHLHAATRDLLLER